MLISVNNIGKETILLGDTNVNYLKRTDNRDIKDIIAAQGYYQLIKDPTRVTSSSSSLIDVLLTNKPSTISNTDVIPLSISDHDCITCTRKLNNARTPHKETYSRNYKDYDANNFINDLRSQNWTLLYTCINVNNA